MKSLIKLCNTKISPKLVQHNCKTKVLKSTATAYEGLAKVASKNSRDRKSPFRMRKQEITIPDACRTFKLCIAERYHKLSCYVKFYTQIHALWRLGPQSFWLAPFKINGQPYTPSTS